MSEASSGEGSAADPGRLSLLTAVVALALAVASFAPIRSYDYFWHLATGRWIFEHHALPLRDPFGVASAPVRWIDGEWLFQLLLYPLYRLGGHLAVNVALAAGTALLFAALFRLVARRDGISAALLVTFVSWFGAESWLRERPSALGAALLLLLLFLLRHTSGARRVIVAALLTIVWFNIHPSALIAPILCALYEAGEALSSSRFGRYRILPPLASAAALLVNPYGFAGIIAPFQLTRIVPLFRNEEWAPSNFHEFQLFWIVAAVTGLLFITRGRDRAHAGNALIALFITVLAVRYCRNQLLFFTTIPLLIAGIIPPLSQSVRRVVAAGAVVAFVLVALSLDHTPGIDANRFPLGAIARLNASALRGNVYNAYGIGGFLIWSVYPERRVVTDGRNELYVEYETAHAAALKDGRRWHELIQRYDLRLAVYDYRHHQPLTLTDPRSGERRSVAADRVYFPRRQWALIAVDRAAMIFARRDAWPEATLRRWEVRRD